MNKFCQSCGMPLHKDNLGTEKDGSKSVSFCSLCYLNGGYIDKELTFEEMLHRGIAGISQSNGFFVSKFLKKMFYPAMLKKVARWNNK